MLKLFATTLSLIAILALTAALPTTARPASPLPPRHLPATPAHIRSI